MSISINMKFVNEQRVFGYFLIWVVKCGWLFILNFYVQVLGI